MSWYNPKEATQVWPKGEYDATILAADPETSNSGKSMYKLTLRLYAGDRTQQVFDYLVSGEASTWKIRAFASAMNATAEFDNGTFDPGNYVNKNVRVQVGVEQSDQYGDKNRVERYLKAGTAPPSPGKAPPAIKDEDIPFE